MEQVLTSKSEYIFGSCGVGTFFNFEKEDKEHTWVDYYSYPKNQTRKEIRKDITEIKNTGGSGWLLTGFISNDECREAYLKLHNEYKIVLQSPVRMNTNSDNEFFFVIWDTTKDIKFDNKEYSFPDMKVPEDNEDEEYD